MIEKTILYFTPILITIFTIIISIMGWSFKKIVIERIDKLEDKLEKIISENSKSHEKIWIEHNSLRERVAKVETRVK